MVDVDAVLTDQSYPKTPTKSTTQFAKLRFV